MNSTYIQDSYTSGASTNISCAWLNARILDLHVWKSALIIILYDPIHPSSMLFIIILLVEFLKNHLVIVRTLSKVKSGRKLFVKVGTVAINIHISAP